MKNIKRIVAAVMAGVLALSQCNIAVFAADNSENKYVKTVSENIAEGSEYSEDIDVLMDDVQVISANSTDSMSEENGVAINEENFPDEYFRIYLYYYDSDRDGFLSSEEIAQIQEVDISIADKIDSLKGIEYLKNLRIISLYGRPIKEVDLSSNLELRELYITALPIASIDLSNNKKLRRITISGTKIEELDLNGLDNIVDLDLSYNHLKSIDVSDKKYLNSLDVQENELEALDLSNNYKLTYLRAGNNKFTELDLSNNEELRELELETWSYGSRTRIDDLDLSNNRKLVYLKVHASVKNSLDISSNEALEIINIASLTLSGFDLADYPELRELYLNVDGVSELDFSNNIKLEKVELIDNLRISSLDFSHNKYLRYINCYSGGLRHLKIYHGEYLKYLYCSDNCLEELDLSDCVNLEYVSCDRNRLTAVDITNDTNIRELRIDGNRIEKIDISGTAFCGSNSDNEDFIQKDNIIMKVKMSQDQYNAFCENADLDEAHIEAEIVEDEYYEIDESTFEDENFRKYIKENLDYNGDGKLSHFEALRANYIILDSNDIKSLKGLQVFTGLGYLECKNIEIDTLDLSCCKSLYWISIINCGLQSINVNNCLQLEYLVVNENNLKELDISNCRYVNYLECAMNTDLQKLTLGDCKSQLRTFKCNKTALTEIDLKCAKNISTISLNKDITSVNLMECKYIMSLAKWFNDVERGRKAEFYIYLSDLEYDYLDALEYIDTDKYPNNIYLKHIHFRTDKTWYYTRISHFQKCEVCGEKITWEKHAPEMIPEVPATCTKEGVKAYYICKCGTFADAECKYRIDDLEKWKAENSIPLTPHSAELIPEVPSSCTVEGIASYYKCVCGYYEDKECTRKIDDLDGWKNAHRLSLADHKWDKGVITTQPSFFNNGVCTYTCEICAETRNEVVNRLNVIQMPVKGKYDIKPAAMYLVSGNAVAANAKKFKYKVDDKKIASVSSKGILKAKKGGIVKVTVYARNAEKKYDEVCSVNVITRNTSVEKKAELDGLQSTINLNKLVNNIPDGYGVRFELSKSNAKKATIDKGILKPLKKGTILVKCIIGEGKYALKKNIKVKVKVK